MRAKRVVDSQDRMYGIRIECPACGPKVLSVRGAAGAPEGRAQWGFNGDYERPTLTPSILGKHFALSEKGRADIEAHFALPLEQRPELPPGHRFDGKEVVCHSFVTDGRIHFLGDCTHEFAGQTLDLLEISD